MQSPLPSVVVAAAFVVVGLCRSEEEEQEKTSFEQKSHFANVCLRSFDFPFLFLLFVAFYDHDCHLRLGKGRVPEKSSCSFGFCSNYLDRYFFSGNLS